MASGLTLPVLAEISVPAPADARGGAGGAAAIRREDFEAFAALPAALAERLGHEPCALMVTGEGAGKRTAAIGLAAAAAVAGRRVALLECDLFAPALASSLGLESAPGLSEYLRHEAEARDILQAIDLAGPAAETDSGAAPRLAVVVGGSRVADGADPLAAPDFAHAVAKLRSAYELLVVDGPPVTRGTVSLSRAAAGLDATIVCVNRSRTSGRSARDLESVLAGLAPPVAGAVLIDG